MQTLPGLLTITWKVKGLQHGPLTCSLSVLLRPLRVVVLQRHRWNHHRPEAARALALGRGGRRRSHHGGQRWKVVVVKVMISAAAAGGGRRVGRGGAFHGVAATFLFLILGHAEDNNSQRQVCRAEMEISDPNPHLLALLHGDPEGLDWTDLEVRELVLRLLSGLLREHTLTIDTAAFPHASHTHSFLHLLGHRAALALAFDDTAGHWVATGVPQLLYGHVRSDDAASKCRRVGKREGVTQTRRLNGSPRVVDVTIGATYA